MNRKYTPKYPRGNMEWIATLIWKRECGIWLTREEEDILLIRKHAVRITSLQWCTETLALNIRGGVVSIKCLLFLSDIWFCWGVWGLVDWCRMLREDKDGSLKKFSFGFIASKIFNSFPKLILDVIEERHKSVWNRFLI